MQEFTLYGNVNNIPNLPNDLKWNEYTYRQTKHEVHSKTKTIPLIWDENLTSKVIYHKWYSYFKEFLDSIPLPYGYIQSAILIKLPAGKSIPTHVDSNQFFKKYHRLHIPIQTNPECIFTVGTISKHLQVGEIWEIDNDNKPHSVKNNGQTDRIHLLIDYYIIPDILISTHNRFMHADHSKIIHENKGVYYGTFLGENNSIWTVSRGTKECLLNIDIVSGSIISEKPIPSTFTHDAIRNDDKVYLTDCDGGSVVILSYPSMTHIKTHRIFTRQNHINTLLFDNGILYCLLHNLGNSILIGINPETGEQLKVYNNVGIQSHGLVKYNNGFLILSSFESSLLYVTETETKVLFKDDKQTFLKGLTKYEDIVYFGASPNLKRIERGSKHLMCELIGFNLETNQMVFRKQLNTCGLINNLFIN